MGPLAEAVDRSSSLDDWVLASCPRAIAYASSLLGDRSAAEDVVQDCYCRLLQKADVYDLPRDGLPLLMKSVSHACINHKSRRRKTASLDVGDFAVDRSATDPRALAMGRELESAIGRALGRLPVPQRAAIELKSLGHSLEEVAEILGVSPNNAGVLVHRGRKAMAVFLAPFLGDPT